ncbi:transposase [Micromonospora sp. A200]|nr:transposase [Micromonospora sp. A200]
MFNGIVWKIRAGAAWRDVPARYGSWQSIYTRFRSWALDGTFARMLAGVHAEADVAGDVDWLASVDSTRSCGRTSMPLAQKGRQETDEAQDHALGRSRGGLTTKIHLACDGAGRTLAFVLSGGNVNDGTRFTHVLTGIRIARPGPGRPRVRPDRVIADKGYSFKAIRAELRRRGIGHTIPERADQQANRRRRGSRGGRPPV